MTRPEGISKLLFDRGSAPEVSRVTAILRKETAGGALLLAATLAALVWANSPWSQAYVSLRDTSFGPASLHLNLSAGKWAADGLLAIFFFVAGLELKREFIAGDLRDPRRAALPIAAAVGGMLVPAGLYLLLTAGGAPGDWRGWAIPIATDIAFAVAVLATIGAHLPAALRTFLLTLAVVDDLLAIVIIAVVFTADLKLGMLAMALVPLAIFWFLAQRRVSHWALLLPLALATWGFVHASGVHATVAGVLLAFTVPVKPDAADAFSAGSLAEHLEHRIRPISAVLAVPVFAFLSAGVTVDGLRGLADAMSDPVAVGVIVGLVVGKPLGITAAAYLVARFTRAHLDPDLSWWDVAGVGLLGGIGFTVSLLIGELAFDAGGTRVEHVKIGVLAGSLLAALLAAAVLRTRNGIYRRLALAETDDPSYM